MKVLVVGKGGREHALAWKLSASPRVEQVYCAPGNAGTAMDAINLPIGDDEISKLIQFVRKQGIGLTVIGPEAPLAAGMADAFRAAGLRVFGPSQAAAQIETSKVFAKRLMRHADVPTAEFDLFDRPDHARTYIQSRRYPVVVKADGLAAGKGVFVCQSTEEALAAVDRIMTREEFGRAAGRQIVVEKRLLGEELSLFALVSGRTILLLPSTQDHKPLLNGDAGPNTGGMGAYCPAPAATDALIKRIEAEVFVPIVHAMKRGQFPFRGVLYAGLMLTPQGPRVLEFNARFGDPEAQPLLLRLQSDLLDLLEAVVDDRLHDLDPDQICWDPRPAVSVVLASAGYPGKIQTGRRIQGLAEVAELPDVKVFHAGTRMDEDWVITDGGRVLAVTALGSTLAEAQQRAYAAVAMISFAGMQYRSDIAARALA